MPCNLAISITKACLPNAQVQQLFTPEIVTSLLRSLALANGATERADSFYDEDAGAYFSLQTLARGRVQCRIGGYYGIDIFVHQGEVTVNATSLDQQAEVERWQAQVLQVMGRAAGALTAAHLQPLLHQLYPNRVTTAQVDVAQAEGDVRPVTRFTIQL